MRKLGVIIVMTVVALVGTSVSARAAPAPALGTDGHGIRTFSYLPIADYFRHARELIRDAHAVKLATEGSDPPAHRLGLYITRTHLYAAQRDSTGTLLFFQRDGQVTRTNLLPPLFSLL